MKKILKKFREFWTNLSLNIRDYFTWIFNYKKLSEEWKRETQQSELNEIDSNKKIEKLHQERELIQKEKDNLISLRDKRIQDLNSQVGKLRNKVTELEKENLKLTTKLQRNEQSRRALAGRVGGFQGTLKRHAKEREKLNNKIDELNNTIQYLKNNLKSPSLDEFRAYEYSQKEVLKRQNERIN